MVGLVARLLTSRYVGPAAAPRYDGLADWYDELNAAAESSRASLAELVGAAPGRCLVWAAVRG